MLRIRQIQVGVLCAGPLSAILLAGQIASANAQNGSKQPQQRPSGQLITPLAPVGSKFSRLNPGLKDFPDYTVGQAVKAPLSPDGHTLLVLTSGYNQLNDAQGHKASADSNEYVFVFDVAHGVLRRKQVCQVPNAFFGLAFAPDGKRFFVSGGADDDVYVFSQSNGAWTETGKPVALGHTSGAGYHQRPMVANLAVTADRKTLVAADMAQDSRTIEDVLGLGHLNLNDEYQRRMTEVFNLKQAAWRYTAITPAPIARGWGALKQSELAPEFHDAQPAAYWARLTRSFDCSREDRVPAVLFNQILWKGLAGGGVSGSAQRRRPEPRPRPCPETTQRAVSL